MCVKNNTEEWVNDETFEEIRVRDKKKYQRFKRTRLHVDHVNYKRSRNQVNNLINRQKMNFIKEKLTENIGNLKILKKLWLPMKKEWQAKICLGKEGNVSSDSKSNAETFKNFYANLCYGPCKETPSTNKQIWKK